ncbi:MAG: 4Fe-4S dicluster domain-containing protein [Planctomycetota bacterium]|jgi:heterodisulfide reductase subunit C
MPVVGAEVLDRLAGRHGLFLCVECGKCAAVCPMGKLFADFSYEASPRGVIERALLGQPMEGHAPSWLCLTCDLCTSLCPAGVRVRDFVEALRAHLVAAGEREYGSFCTVCGAYLWPRHTVEHLKGFLTDAAEAHLTLCPRCRRYNHGRTMRALAPPRTKR